MTFGLMVANATPSISIELGSAGMSRKLLKLR